MDSKIQTELSLRERDYSKGYDDKVDGLPIGTIVLGLCCLLAIAFFVFKLAGF